MDNLIITYIIVLHPLKVLNWYLQSDQNQIYSVFVNVLFYLYVPNLLIVVYIYSCSKYVFTKKPWNLSTCLVCFVCMVYIIK